MGSLKNRRVTTRNRLIATVMVVIILTTLAGCDSATSTEVVSAQACFSKREIEIPLRTNRYWGLYDAFAYFDSRKTLEQIKEKVLEWDSQATVEIWGNQSLFVSSDNPDTGKKDYYVIYRINGTNEKLSKKKYRLDNCTQNNGCNVKDEPYAILMTPFHLIQYIDDEYSQQYHINENECYELHTEATIEDVYNFYNDSGYYEVEKDNNKVMLNKLLLDESEYTNYESFQISDSYVIEVFNKDGKSYIKYTYDE